MSPAIDRDHAAIEAVGLVVPFHERERPAVGAERATPRERDMLEGSNDPSGRWIDDPERAPIFGVRTVLVDPRNREHRSVAAEDGLDGRVFAPDFRDGIA